jgi:hypothetical protein
MNSVDAKQEPVLVNLDEKNSVQILSQYVEVAQKKGAYLLQEAEVLKRSMDVLLNNVHDKDINNLLAKQLLIQGVQKGQSHGAYSLNDASLLNKVVQFVANSFPQESSGSSVEPSSSGQNNDTQPSSSQDDSKSSLDDLTDLAEPIPLKPKEV